MDNFILTGINALWQVLALILAALSPLLIGLIIAYLLNPVVDWMRPKFKGWSIFLTYLGVILALGGLVYGFVVLILGSMPSGGIYQTIESVTGYFRNSYQVSSDFLAKYLPLSVAGEAGEASESIVNWFKSKFSLSVIVGAATSISGGLVSLFLGFVCSIYLLKDKDFFLRLWGRFLSLTMKQKTHGIINEAMSEINGVVTTFLKGALVDSLIVAFLSSLVLTILKVDFAVIIGVFGGVLNIIPYFGPFFGMIPAFLVALFTDGLAKGILAVLGLFIVQQIDCNLIYPKIVGEATGLHPFFVLLSVSIFGYLFGILGMIAAVPAAGILQIFIRKWAYSKA